MSAKGLLENNASANLTRVGEEDSSSFPNVARVFLGGISLLAFLGNGLVCLAILRNRNILRFPYNKFLFSLAITDMLTGVFILVTPTLVIDDDSFPVLVGFAGELFCRLVFSQYFVYALSKVSVFTIAAMSLERWYSILRPIQYRLNFKTKKIYGYLLVIWLLGFGSTGFIPFGRVFIPPTNECVWSWAPFHRELLIILYVFFTFFAPSAIACLTILHIYFVIKRCRLRKTGNGNAKAKRKLLGMCSFVVFLQTFCWLPNQLYYALSAYNITTLETTFHYFTTVLAMSNSCLNPWIYCFANRQIKTGILSLLHLVLRPFKKRKSSGKNLQGDERGKVTVEMRNINDIMLLSYRNLTLTEREL